MNKTKKIKNKNLKICTLSWSLHFSGERVNKIYSMSDNNKCDRGKENGAGGKILF